MCLIYKLQNHIVTNNCFLFTGSYYVTWGGKTDGGSTASAPGAPLPTHGKPLGKLSQEDFKAVIEKGMLQYSMCICLLPHLSDI